MEVRVQPLTPFLRMPLTLFVYLFICLLVKIGFLIGLAFTSSSRLASQQAPVSCRLYFPSARVTSIGSNNRVFHEDSGD